MDSDDVGMPSWRASGRNGYWAVDEHREGSSATWGDALIFTTRRDATKVADALNAAYQRGRGDGAAR